MKIKLSKKSLVILSNKYVLASIVFAVWMSFIDTNSLLIHADLRSEINRLEDDVAFYQKQLVDMRRELTELESNPEAFEKYAREKFWMHKPNEHIVLVEFREED